MWKSLTLVLLLATGCAHQVPTVNTLMDSEAATWTDSSLHRSGFIMANGIKLHYLDWGGNGETLVLLAGLGNTAHVFDLSKRNSPVSRKRSRPGRWQKLRGTIICFSRKKMKSW